MTASIQLSSRARNQAPVVFRPEAIRELLSASGLPMHKFAMVAGVTKQAVSQWTNGLTVPYIGSMLMLVNAFDLEVTYFFRRDAEAAPGALTERPRAMRGTG